VDATRTTRRLRAPASTLIANDASLCALCWRIAVHSKRSTATTRKARRNRRPDSPRGIRSGCRCIQSSDAGTKRSQAWRFASASASIAAAITTVFCVPAACSSGRIERAQSWATTRRSGCASSCKCCSYSTPWWSARTRRLPALRSSNTSDRCGREYTLIIVTNSTKALDVCRHHVEFTMQVVAIVNLFYASNEEIIAYYILRKSAHLVRPFPNRGPTPWFGCVLSSELSIYTRFGKKCRIRGYSQMQPRTHILNQLGIGRHSRRKAPATTTVTQDIVSIRSLSSLSHADPMATHRSSPSADVPLWQPRSMDMPVDEGHGLYDPAFMEHVIQWHWSKQWNRTTTVRPNNKNDAINDHVILP